MAAEVFFEAKLPVLETELSAVTLERSSPNTRLLLLGLVLFRHLHGLESESFN